MKPVSMKSRSASEWLKSYGGIHQELTARGFTQNPNTLKSYFTENEVRFQLVPPHCHRHNGMERAIITFKEHIVTGLASVDPYLPMHLWDRLLHQAEMMLNLLHTSRQHPQLSAAAHFHGLIDYNKIAFTPVDHCSISRIVAIKNCCFLLDYFKEVR
jgi:hypothetical protein